MLLQGGGEKIASGAETGKKGGVGVGVVKIWIYFSLPFSDLTGNKVK